MTLEEQLAGSVKTRAVSDHELQSAIRSAHECLSNLFHSSASPVDSAPLAEESRRVARKTGAGASRPASGSPAVWRSDRAGETEVGGFWCGELEADTTLESDYILFLHLLDADAYREKIRKLANFVLRHQLDDGSWNIYHGGPGEISASVKAYVALRLAGYRKNGPRMKRARDAILRMGGVERVNSYTKVYLSLLELFPWKKVPALPPEVVLLPRFFYFNIYEISYWSRAILIPLSILYAKWPRKTTAHRLPRDLTSIDELIVGDPPRTSGAADDTRVQKSGADAHAPAGTNGVHRTVSRNGHSHSNSKGTLDAPKRNGSHRNGKARNGLSKNGSSVETLESTPPATESEDPTKGSRLFSWRRFFLFMNRVLQIAEKTPVKPLRGLALKKAERWMVQRLEDSDGLGAIFPSMVNSVLALLCLGYSKEHRLIQEGLEKLEELEIEEGDEIRLQPCLSPVWDTALAMNALGEAGVAPDDEQLVEAGRWLVSKEIRRPGDWQKRVRKAEVSGWAFQFRNDFYPDIDDSAAVLMALGRIEPTKVEGLVGAIERGINWTLSLQSSNGGWAAFDADVEREVFNQVPYADHNAMLDPACADITGRVLEMFGRFPSLRRYEKVRASVQKGIRYLRSSQEPDGSWYGRWGVNYIYGTWQALKGLMEVGEDPKQSYIRRAVEFLKSRQNRDGGWGESCLSYDNPGRAGEGPTTASQTAWALMGLIAAGEHRSEAVQKGVRWLIDHQGRDGNWAEAQWTGTGFPSVFYLKYHMYRLYFPTFALAMYKNALSGTTGESRPVAREFSQLDLERRTENANGFASNGRSAPTNGNHAADEASTRREAERDAAGVLYSAPAPKGVFRSLFGLLG